MAILRIVKYGEEPLARKAEPVTSWDAELERIVRDMEETMHAARGIGLAANQVALPLDLTIIDLEPATAESHLWVLTNAVVVEASGVVKEEEGCLSLPGLVGVVDRPEKVLVRYQDLHGEEAVIEGTGLLARALSHELDHLAGTLFPQRIPGIRGDMVRRKARKMLRQGEWEDAYP